MTAFAFPDTTVLRNFATIDRIKLLKAILNGRGRWTAAVADEVTNSIPYEPRMADILAGGWLGEPIEIVDDHLLAEVLRIRRTAFGGNDGHPHRHLGEAETCTLILCDPDFAGSAWISDDRKAFRYARGQGIRTFDTAGLLGQAAANRVIGADEGLALLHRMTGCGRSVRIPATPAELIAEARSREPLS